MFLNTKKSGAFSEIEKIEKIDKLFTLHRTKLRKDNSLHILSNVLFLTISQKRPSKTFIHGQNESNSIGVFVLSASRDSNPLPYPMH